MTQLERKIAEGIDITLDGIAEYIRAVLARVRMRRGVYLIPPTTLAHLNFCFARSKKGRTFAPRICRRAPSAASARR